MMQVASGLDVVRVPGWERYTWLRHGFSTRWGGVSPVYGGGALNLGWTKEDDPSCVEENRRRFVGEVGGEQDDDFSLVGLRQLHSAVIQEVRASDGALEGKLATAEGKAVLEGDGIVTDVAGVLIAVGTADCVPVLVADVERRVVAAFHAGWRGTVAGIVECGIGALRERYGSRVEDLVAVVGPSIGPCCYSVGEEVREEFAAHFGYGEQMFAQVDGPEPWRRDGTAGEIPEDEIPEDGGRKLHLDLWEANRRQLRGAGLSEEQITVLGQCTACSRDHLGRLRYFSHRGEGGVAGRMLGAIGVAGQAAESRVGAIG